MAGRRGRRSTLKSGAAGGGRPDAMDELRRRIDAIDRRMVQLLNDRAGCAIALGRIKQKRGLPIYQPAREEEVLGNVQRTNDGPLQSEALRRLFERIIDESRRIERIATDGGGAASPGRSATGAPGDPGDPKD